MFEHRRRLVIYVMGIAISVCAVNYLEILFWLSRHVDPLGCVFIVDYSIK